MKILPEPTTATEFFTTMMTLRKAAKVLPRIYFTAFDCEPYAVVTSVDVLFVFPRSAKTTIIAELVRTRTHFVEVGE